MNRISVITAAFNARDAVQRTIESVAAQGVEALEHIVVDGGSADGTREYLESLGDKVRWISEPDRGIADAMNKGVAMAQGDYVLVLQAGDTFLSDDSLQRAMPHLDGTPLVNFAVLFSKIDGREYELPARPLSTFTEFRLLNPHQGLFTHCKVFASIGSFDESVPIVMDYDHLLRAKHAGFALKVVDEVLSVMPADGISSREDWASKHKLLRDQANVQWKNANGLGHKAALAVFWAGFYPAYFLKWRFLRNFRFY